ncbi:hypothetical protein [Mycolicibacter minnesotensis]
METVNELTAEHSGQWLIADVEGARQIVDLDTRCFYPPESEGRISKEAQRLAETPRIGEPFGEGSTVRRIMQLPDLVDVSVRFAEGWGQWISVELGWYPIIAELDAALVEVEPDFEYHQIKEKFGELRVYVDIKLKSPKARAVIAAAQQKAAVTCERCGDTDTARMRTKQQWLQTLCDTCAEAKGCDEYGVGDTVDALSPEMRGVWRVTTQGSTHIWDMDNRTYTRFPGEHSLSGAFEFDREPQPITRVDRYPVVGSYFLIWYDDPADPERREQFRRSSGIERIERVR